jgi:Zn ribbon nucleic-acid-binding protein
MRIADAFQGRGMRPDLLDHDFILTCSCGTTQRLDEMAIDVCGEITLYDCVRCTSSMVGVLADDPARERWSPGPMTRRQEAGGHRLNGYVIGSKVDVGIRPSGDDRDIALIPATPNFFIQYRYA